MEKRQLIGTTTIVIVLFTILLLGGSTMPLIRLVDIEDAKAHRRNKKDVNLSKTEKMVSAGVGGRGRQGRGRGPADWRWGDALRTVSTYLCMRTARTCRHVVAHLEKGVVLEP